MLLSRQVFPNNSGVENQKRKHKKYCVTVRPQSEKYHTKPRVTAMERRHRYIFCPSYSALFLLVSLALSRCVLHTARAALLVHIFGKREGDAVSSKQEAKRRKNGELYEAAESGAVIGCGQSARVCC